MINDMKTRIIDNLAETESFYNHASFSLSVVEDRRATLGSALLALVTLAPTDELTPTVQ